MRVDERELQGERKTKGSRAISVSLEVWEYIASKGKFGESFDTVIRRLLGIPNKRK